MANILLTPEEIEEIVKRHREGCIPWDGSFVREGAIAEAKKMVEWLEKEGIWAQVPHITEDGIKEETMWCLYPSDLQALKEVLGE